MKRLMPRTRMCGGMSERSCQRQLLSLVMSRPSCISQPGGQRCEAEHPGVIIKCRSKAGHKRRIIRVLSSSVTGSDVKVGTVLVQGFISVLTCWLEIARNSGNRWPEPPLAIQYEEYLTSSGASSPASSSRLRAYFRVSRSSWLLMHFFLSRHACLGWGMCRYKVDSATCKRQNSL